MMKTVVWADLEESAKEARLLALRLSELKKFRP